MNEHSSCSVPLSTRTVISPLFWWVYSGIVSCFLMCPSGECWQGEQSEQELGKYKLVFFLGGGYLERNVSVDEKCNWTFQQELEWDRPSALFQVCLKQCLKQEANNQRIKQNGSAE